MGKRILSILIIYIIVFLNVSNCYVYADYSTDSKVVCDIDGINDKLVVSEIYKDESSGSKQSDRIIVSLGDSYSSGEGIPPFFGQYDVNGMDVPFNKKVQDDDWLAHRSMYAWSGMLNLPGVDGTMAENKGTHWYFAAVSGAETKNIQYLDKNDRDRAQKLLSKDKLTAEEEEELEGYGYQKKEYSGDGVTGVRWLEPQLNIFDKLGDKKADYVTITIGGNDLGFVDIIAEVVLGVNYFDKSKLWSKVNNALKEISDDGKTTKALKEAFFRVTKIAGSSATVIVAGYPLLFEYSGKGDVVSILEALKIDMAVFEFDKALEKMVNECDSKYSDDAKLEYVSVINAFENHEAYSDDSYINPVILSKQEEDIYEEKIIKGEIASAYSMHPNYKGSVAYAKCVQKAIDELEKKRKDNVYAKQIYKDKYLKILTDNETQIKRYSWQYAQMGDDPTPISLYDIDGDGVPELFFITADENKADVRLNIYTCDDEGVYELYNETLIFVAANHNQRFCIVGSKYNPRVFVYTFYTDWGSGEEILSLRMNNSSIDIEESAYHLFDMDSQTDTYSYGKDRTSREEISEDEYKVVENRMHTDVDVLLFNDQYMMNNQLIGYGGLSYTYDEAIIYLGGDIIGEFSDDDSTTIDDKVYYADVLERDGSMILKYDWQYRDSGATPTPVAFYDIDRNGIFEMIILSVDKNNEHAVLLSIYTCNSDGTAKEIYCDLLYSLAQYSGKCFCLVGSNDRSELILWVDDTASNFSERYYILSMKEGKISIENVLHHYEIEGNETQNVYVYLGDEVTKEVYEEQEDLLHENVSVILYDDYYLKRMKRKPYTPSNNYSYTYEEVTKYGSFVVDKEQPD